MRWVPAFAVLATAALACGPSAPPAEAPGRPAAETAYPALRHVPADAAFAVATARVSDAVALLREVAHPVALAQSRDLAALETELRERLGVSLLDTGELADAGIDVDRGAAVFGGAQGVTVVAPVADPGRVARFFARLRPASGVGLGQVRGHEVASWPLPDGRRLAWAVVDGWLLLRSDAGAGGHAWLERALDPARPGMAGAADFSRALERARAVLGPVHGRRPALVGVVRSRELGALAPCATGAASAAPTLLIAGASGWDFSDAFVEAELSPAAARELAAAATAPPPPGFAALRADAGVAAGLALAPDWLARVGAGNPCLAALGVGDPFAMLGWQPPPRSLHLAGTGLDLGELAGQLAVHLELSSRAFVDRQLGAIPMRSFFERGDTIAGQRVRVLGVPSYPEIYYRLTEGSLSVTLGRPWMQTLLSRAAGDGEQGGARELVSLALRPDRVGDLEGLIAAVSTAWMGYHDARATSAQAAALRRYQLARARLVLDGGRLRLRARVRLRH